MKKTTGIILFDKNGKILLQHRTKDAPSSPGKWSIFGGAIEEGENPLKAVKRECFEEIEYKLKNPKLILKIIYNEKIAHIFIEEYDTNKKLVLNEGDDMGWFNFKEIKKLDASVLMNKIIEAKIEEIVNSQT